jgi:molybdenum cofactor cytidylyltransferase
VAAILMAAGESRRWGEGNKLIADIDGRPMLRRTAETLLKSGVRPVLAVTGHEPDAVAAALAGLDITLRHAPDYAAGMSASLKTGIAAVPDDCDAAMICLGDMPFVRPDTFRRLTGAYDPAAGWEALFPTLIPAYCAISTGPRC